MLYLIGLGLGNEKDVTMAGLEVIQSSDEIHLESYTSLLSCTKEDLEKLYKKPIQVADRTAVEQNNNHILAAAKDKTVSLLVIGDPMCATTHIDLLLRAKEQGIKVQIIHNASIISAVGITGLQVYKFGKVTSIPFENEKVDTPYTVLKYNKSIGLHTLFLLDLRPDENRYLSVSQAVDYLLKKEQEKKENQIDENTLAIGLARVGAQDQLIRAATLKELKEIDFGKPVHSLIIPGDLHFMEEEALELYK